MSAVDVGPPFAVRSVVVQIEHRCYRIYPQAVQMEIFQPAAGTGDQERADFAFSVVKYSGAPALVFHFQGVGIFIAVCTVELAESHRILREVCRHPVQNNTDACLMKHVYHFPEVVRCAVSGGRCEIAGDLIPPRAVERVFRQRHKFNVGVGHLFQIGNDLLCEANIAGELFLRLVFPRRNVHLIDVHGAFVGDVFFLFQLPVTVLPDIAAFEQLGSRSRPSLIVSGIGVGFVQNLTIFSFDAVFITVKLFQSGQLCLPYRVRDLVHRVTGAVPLVE